jgi:hypothetical protein
MSSFGTFFLSLSGLHPSIFDDKPHEQEMVERILYIWAIRHPASGYVQGINDLVTPFLIVFLQDHVEQDVTRAHCQVEGPFLTLPGRGSFPYNAR